MNEKTSWMTQKKQTIETDLPSTLDHKGEGL